MRRGVLKLLEIKDSDVRILMMEQCRDAVDKGLHSGGAFSATIPLVALFYGGFIDFDVENPTRPGQDLFVLSKGHAVAALASIYAELGYFDKSVLKNSRSWESILNGHPGPLLPGIHVATGPMGQGMPVAQGFALAGKGTPAFDAYAVTGDGELQEGNIWEAVMYAGQKHLDNLCVLVDKNNGQLDIASKTVFPMPELERVFESFGWRAVGVDATQYGGVFDALEEFRYGKRNGRPTASICHTTKGFGSGSDALNKHKPALSDNVIEQELVFQTERRVERVAEFASWYESAEDVVREQVLRIADTMKLSVRMDGFRMTAKQVIGPVLTRRAAPRDRKIRYDSAALPRIDPSKEIACSDIVTAAMKVFARDARVVSIDSDLGTTSGLEAGVAHADQRRALNVGVAEANMMTIGEGFAALGYNTWVSTFCPFFNWQVMRRIAVGQQERLEVIRDPHGWLGEGHALDLTFLATAADFETRTNGATHMGNDDVMVFDSVGNLRIVSISCPQQMLGFMKWVMEGNRGLVYIRVMRAPSGVIYDNNFEFEYGRAWALRESSTDRAVIVSSCRGVHEALKAADLCAKDGTAIGVIDMPSVDEEKILGLLASNKPVIFAEQNNGYLWQNAIRIAARHGCSLGRAMAVNTLTSEMKPQFIHSGTYAQLIEAFELSAAQLAARIKGCLA
jgi:transketolase